MRIRILILTVALVSLAHTGGQGGTAEAAGADAKSGSAATNHRNTTAGPARRAHVRPVHRRGARSHRRLGGTKATARRYRAARRPGPVGEFNGHQVDPSRLRAEPAERPSGAISLYLVNFREEVAVHLYDENGTIDKGALATLDHAFRCRRSGKERAVDPRLYETLSAVYDRFGQRPIHLVSGFRDQTNHASRHFQGAAMDIRIPGVAPSQLYSFVESLDTGGMGVGLYPTSDFVHIDYRAPGEKSYRWTDTSGPGSSSPRKRHRKRKPNS